MKNRLPQKPGNNPNNKKPNDRMIEPKVLIIWLAILGALLAVATVGNSFNTNVMQMSITEVVKMASKDEVLSGSIVNDVRGGESWYKIEGIIRPLEDEVTETAVAPNRFFAEVSCDPRRL